MNKHIIDDIADRLAELLPPPLQSARERFHERVRGVLQSKLADLDLVSRQDFEATQKTLAETKAQLAELERQIAELEAQGQNKGA